MNLLPAWVEYRGNEMKQVGNTSARPANRRAMLQLISLGSSE